MRKPPDRAFIDRYPLFTILVVMAGTVLLLGLIALAVFSLI